MSKNYTDVATSAMQSVQSSVASAIGGMRGVHSNLGTSVPSGLNPYWDGSAHDVFEAGFTAFLGRLSLYIADCEQLNGNLDAARKNYEGAEGAAQSGVGSIPSIPSDMGSIGAPPGTVLKPDPAEEDRRKAEEARRKAEEDRKAAEEAARRAAEEAAKIAVGSLVQLRDGARDINRNVEIWNIYEVGGARVMTVTQVGRTKNGVWEADYYVCSWGGVVIGGFRKADLVKV